MAIGYLLYWKRTTERAIFLGMVGGYVGGFAWFLAIKWAEAAGFAADASSGALAQLTHALFVEGGGLDPSYATTLVPLVLIPIVSLMGTSDEGGDAFYERLA